MITKIQDLEKIQDLDNIQDLDEKSLRVSFPSLFVTCMCLQEVSNQYTFPLQTLHPEKVLPVIKGQKATETGKPDSRSMLLSEKGLDQKGERKKKMEISIKQELGDKKGKLSCPETIEESNKNKDSSSFLASIQPTKSHEFFVYYRSHDFVFPSIKVFSSPCCAATCMWLTIVVNLKVQSSADPQ